MILVVVLDLMIKIGLEAEYRVIQDLSIAFRVIVPLLMWFS
jgi:hypothetical protein